MTFALYKDNICFILTLTYFLNLRYIKWRYCKDFEDMSYRILSRVFRTIPNSVPMALNPNGIEPTFLKLDL